jgi:hypothetical protein
MDPTLLRMNALISGLHEDWGWQAMKAMAFGRAW